MDSINYEPKLSDDQEREFDRLDAVGDQNAIQIREHLGVIATEEAINEPKTQDNGKEKLRPPRKAKNPREKAWADARPDLKPFPYGTAEE